MLTIEKLSVHYGRLQALREVSLDVSDGEIVTIIGANGAGKTSLLNAICGVIPSSGGRVGLEDKEVRGLPPHEVVKLGISYVPEGRQILGSMTVLDNLMLGAYVHCTGNWRRLLGFAPAILKEKPISFTVERVFELFPRLRERQKQLAGSLSGGEQQMLAIGRALMSSPKLLLLDEPSIGLAPNLVRETLAMVATLRREGLTILLVEQDAIAALRIADRGYVMERGRIALEGSSSQLLADEEVRYAYLGRRRLETRR